MAQYLPLVTAVQYGQLQEQNVRSRGRPASACRLMRRGYTSVRCSHSSGLQLDAGRWEYPVVDQPAASRLTLSRHLIRRPCPRSILSTTAITIRPPSKPGAAHLLASFRHHPYDPARFSRATTGEEGKVASFVPEIANMTQGLLVRPVRGRDEGSVEAVHLREWRGDGQRY